MVFLDLRAWGKAYRESREGLVMFFWDWIAVKALLTFSVRFGGSGFPRWFWACFGGEWFLKSFTVIDHSHFYFKSIHEEISACAQINPEWENGVQKAAGSHSILPTQEFTGLVLYSFICLRRWSKCIGSLRLNVCKECLHFSGYALGEEWLRWWSCKQAASSGNRGECSAAVWWFCPGITCIVHVCVFWG